MKSTTALRVVTPLLEEPVTDRPNWTLARLRAAIEAREGLPACQEEADRIAQRVDQGVDLGAGKSNRKLLTR